MQLTIFERLAPEIISNIVNHAADIRDIKNIRLTNKILNDHAVRALFRETFIRPAKDSVARWNQVADCAPLTQLARRAVIHTVKDITQDHPRDKREGDDEVEASYQKAVSALAKFPKLDSLLVAFSEQCLGLERPNPWGHVPEPAKSRLERLQLIFNAIETRQSAGGNSPIRSLTITNLQNQPHPDFTSSNVFRDVMSQLDQLHVQFVQEYNEHGPDNDYARIELQTFPGYLCSAWLGPIAVNLRELSLYSGSENWGVLPGYFDPSGIAFPKLETLSLGYYTIAYDDRLDWLLSIKCLKKLVMHRCMIASHLTIDGHNIERWKTSTRDWVALGNAASEWSRAYTYGQGWSVIFDALAAELPNLHTFVFDYPDRLGYARHGLGGNAVDRRIYGVEGRHDTATSCFPERYVVFDNGILPTHWPEADYEGTLELDDEEANYHQEHLEKDQAALDNLLKACRSRR